MSLLSILSSSSSSSSSKLVPICVVIIFCLSKITIADVKLTAYDALEAFNFPHGLLPKGSLGYDLNDETGNFNAYLNGSCSFALEGSYQLRYRPTISGIISENKLTNLSGVSVKVMFVWLNIVEIRRKGDNLEFSVGIMSADFPVDNFDESPQCGCGINCNYIINHHHHHHYHIGDFVDDD